MPNVPANHRIINCLLTSGSVQNDRKDTWVKHSCRERKTQYSQEMSKTGVMLYGKWWSKSGRKKTSVSAGIYCRCHWISPESLISFISHKEDSILRSFPVPPYMIDGNACSKKPGMILKKNVINIMLKLQQFIKMMIKKIFL